MNEAWTNEELTEILDRLDIDEQYLDHEVKLVHERYMRITIVLRTDQLFIKLPDYFKRAPVEIIEDIFKRILSRKYKRAMFSKEVAQYLASPKFLDYARYLYFIRYRSFIRPTEVGDECAPNGKASSTSVLFAAIGKFCKTNPGLADKAKTCKIVWQAPRGASPYLEVDYCTRLVMVSPYFRNMNIPELLKQYYAYIGVCKICAWDYEKMQLDEDKFQALKRTYPDMEQVENIKRWTGL